MKNPKKLDQFLKQHNACEDCHEFGKDLTLEQFLNTCERGDWILWLFARTNLDDFHLISSRIPPKKTSKDVYRIALAVGHCANTVRHLIRHERSLKALDVVIAFGEKKVGLEELDAARWDAEAGLRSAGIALSDADECSNYAYVEYLDTDDADDDALAAADADYRKASDEYNAALAAQYAAQTSTAAVFSILGSLHLEEVAHIAAQTAYATSHFIDDYAADARSRKKANQKLTADICRKYLPLKIWDQTKL